MIDLRYIKRISQYWIIIGITVLLIFFIEMSSKMIIFVYNNYYSYDNNGKIDYRANRAKGYYTEDLLWLNDYNKEDSSSFTLRWEPYVYWRTKKFVGKYINVDLNGIRYTKQWNIQSKETDKVVKIFMFGGSTLWGTGARDDNTIPSLVAKRLSKYGINANITNYGESGYVNTQEVILLFLQLQKHNIPDIVIFYDGVNDVFSALQNGKAGLPQNEFNRVNEFNITKDNNVKIIKLLLSKILERSATYRLSCIATNRSVNYNRGTKSILDRNDYNKSALDVINTYISNIDLVNKMSCGRFTSMFYWQPVLYDKCNLTEYERKQWPEHIDKEFYTTVNTVFKLKASIFNAYHFYNIENIFMDERKPIFIDFCHLNEKGNEIIANRITDDILTLIHNGNINTKHSR
jgi:lysophospholipase L1-like esterase